MCYNVDGIETITKSISPFCVELLVSTFMATKSSEIVLTLLAVLLTDFCYCEVTSYFYTDINLLLAVAHTS